MKSNTLEQSYRDTIYKIAMPHSDIAITIGETCPDLDVVLEEFHKKSWCVITASNPFSKRLSNDENARRNFALLNDLSAYRCHKAWGIPQNGKWKPEQSICVFGIPFKLAIEAAMKHQQNAIVFGRYKKFAELHWTL